MLNKILILIACGVSIIGLIVLWFAIKEMFQELYDLRVKEEEENKDV